MVAGSMELGTKDVGCSGWEIGGSDGVGMFVAERWMDGVVGVEGCSGRVLILTVVLDSGLLDVLAVCNPHSERP